ncbi:hypothetical protein ACUOA9_27960, partial [Escherichia sp. HC-TM1]
MSRALFAVVLAFPLIALANFQHPTLKHNLTTLKALHHVAWMDDTLHV